MAEHHLDTGRKFPVQMTANRFGLEQGLRVDEVELGRGAAVAVEVAPDFLGFIGWTAEVEALLVPGII